MGRIHDHEYDTIIMIGAAVPSLRGGVAAALFPLFTGLLLAFVVYRRLRLAPHRGATKIGIRTANVR